MDLQKDQYWEGIIRKFIKSKQTKAKFCRDNNIKTDQFYSQINKLHPELISKSKGRPGHSKSKITSFIPVKYDQPKGKIFNIHLQSGIKISFKLLPEHLPAFIKKLEGSNESNISL
jgi:hypothetical protein